MLVNPYDVRSKRYKDLNDKLTELEAAEGGSGSSGDTVRFNDELRYTSVVVVATTDPDMNYLASAPGATHFSFTNLTGDTVYLEYQPSYSYPVPSMKGLSGKLASVGAPIGLKSATNSVLTIEFTQFLED